MCSLEKINTDTIKIFPEPLYFEEAVREVSEMLDGDRTEETQAKYSVQVYFDALEEKESYDQMFFKHLMHNEVKNILPFVSGILSEHHRGNPIFRGEVDRESLARIVDRVYRRIQSEEKMPQCGFEDSGGNWCLRALINVMVLMELLVW